VTGFTPPDDARASREDLDFWRPHLVEILERHGLRSPGASPTAGGRSTYPVFLCGDAVVKLFGGTRSWRSSFESERAAHARLAADPGIAAPRLLAHGRLCERESAAWPYLVTTRMPGCAWQAAGLGPAERRALAAETGELIRRVHALPAAGAATDLAGTGLDPAAAAARSSLPPHLVARVDAYLARLGPPDRVFVHGDVTGAHLFVDGGRLCGLIDWGDAAVTDRHYELIQILRDAFDCDRELLRIFLDASAWPMAEDFPDRALGHALWRQAAGVAQHHTMDVFEPVAARWDLAAIATLEGLARTLFAL